jgi:hypothetical protein
MADAHIFQQQQEEEAEGTMREAAAHHDEEEDDDEEGLVRRRGGSRDVRRDDGGENNDEEVLASMREEDEAEEKQQQEREGSKRRRAKETSGVRYFWGDPADKIMVDEKLIYKPETNGYFPTPLTDKVYEQILKRGRYGRPAGNSPVRATSHRSGARCPLLALVMSHHASP